VTDRLLSMSARSRRSAPGRAARLGAFALSWLALVLFAGCLTPTQFAAHAGRGIVLSGDPFADDLVARAKKAKLARSKGWLRLVHYRKDVLNPRGTPYSEADGTSFFLAPFGKFDPEAELEATLRAILAPVGGTSDKELDAHPACRFPARTLYLMRELDFEFGRLGVTHCPRFNQHLAALNPGSATLIFTSYYLNNPASAFGHTFLRIDKAGTLAVGKKRELLDFGIDFSADVTTSNPILYAFMGMTGLFQGTFKRVPYYYKVREYNDVETRDLWEYQLDLTDEQLLLLAAHLWEVGQTHFDYFYLGENCSYHILGLIAAVRPELDLLEGLSSPVVPAQTVQLLAAQPGLVRAKRYRPSLRTQFEARIAPLSFSQRELVARLAQDPDAPLPDELPKASAIGVLDAAMDLIDVRFAKEILKEREGEGSRRKQRLLERRASSGLGMA
jgi:hypothetical protein